MRANRVLHARVGDIELVLDGIDPPAVDEAALKRIVDDVVDSGERDRVSVYEALGLPRLPRPNRSL